MVFILFYFLGEFRHVQMLFNLTINKQFNNSYKNNKQTVNEGCNYVYN